MKTANAIADICVIEPPWNRPRRRRNPDILMKAGIVPEAIQLSRKRGGDRNVALRRAELLQSFAACIKLLNSLQERWLALGNGLAG
jgi:hypothetical protein